jgi:hypothetical protein
LAKQHGRTVPIGLVSKLTHGSIQKVLLGSVIDLAVRVTRITCSLHESRLVVET